MSSRTADVVATLRELLAAMGVLLDFDVAGAESELQRTLGLDVLSTEALAGAGIDVQAGAAAFSREVLPTFAVPVADEDRITAFLEARRADTRLHAQRYRDHEIYTWRLGEHTAIHVVRRPGWLLFSLTADLDAAWNGPDTGDDDDDDDDDDGDGDGADPDDTDYWSADAAWLADTSWLDGALDARESGRPHALAHALAHSLAHALAAPLVAARRRHGRSRAPAVLGMLRPAPILQTLDRRTGSFRACLPLAKIAREVTLAADVDWNRGGGMIAVELTAAAASELSAHTTPTSAAWRAYRSEAPLQASWAVDPRWLDELRRAVGCPLLGSPVNERSWLPADSPVAVHAALWELDRDALRLRGGVHLALRARSFVDALLDLIPQRRLLERSRTVAGQPVKVIAVPLVPELTYHLTDRSFTALAGANDAIGAIGALVSEADPAPGPLELGVVAVAPASARDLDATLTQLADLSGRASESFARRTARRLRRYALGRVRLELDGTRLILRADMRLR